MDAKAQSAFAPDNSSASARWPDSGPKGPNIKITRHLPETITTIPNTEIPGVPKTVLETGLVSRLVPGTGAKSHTVSGKSRSETCFAHNRFPEQASTFRGNPSYLLFQYFGPLGSGGCVFFGGVRGFAGNESMIA